MQGSARKTNWTWRGGDPVSTIYGHIGEVGGVACRSNAWTLESHLECVAKTWRDFQNTWKSECVKNVKVLGWPGFTIQEHFFPCRWSFLFHCFVATPAPCKAMLDTAAPEVSQPTEEVGTLSIEKWVGRLVAHRILSCREMLFSYFHWLGCLPLHIVWTYLQSFLKKIHCV